MDEIQQRIRNLIQESLVMKTRNIMNYLREAAGDTAIRQMNRIICSCDKCQSPYKTRTIGTGNPCASLMVIMDYPSAKQAGLNKTVSVFEGNEKLETFLKQIFQEFRIDFSQIFFMNVTNCCFCFSDGRERAPMEKEIHECETYIKYAIDVIHPPMILLLGSVASSMYVRHQSSFKVRGTWQNIYGIPAMPTYSPNEIKDYQTVSLEKARKMLELFKNDIQRALKEYQKRWPESKLFV